MKTLIAKNGEKFLKNQIIALMESTGDHNQISELIIKIDSTIKLLNRNSTLDPKSIFAHPFYSLGELQIDYEKFLSLVLKLDAISAPNDRIHHQPERVILYSELLALKEAALKWINQYTIKSPAEGLVIWHEGSQKNEYFENGAFLGSIQGSKSEQFGEIKLSQYAIAKIDTGLRVQLRLDGYPYIEYGCVTGKIKFVSDEATDSGFLATVKLDSGMITTQKLKIPQKLGLTGQAIIITNDIRLFKRLFANIF